MGFRYEDLIHLDAENLAEQGILEAYQNLKPDLQKFVSEPAGLIEEIDEYATYYRVKCDTRSFEIYSPELKADGWNSWGRAKFAFFKIVNLQLRGMTHRFYAVNGGNDLGGIFMTPAEAAKIRRAWSRPQDWPYLPKLDPPWYGQSHL